MNVKALTSAEIIAQNQNAIPLTKDRDPANSFVLEDVNVNENNRLTIKDLELENAREIWVINQSRDRNAGCISFQVQGDNGLLPVEVPYTFVAINLAEYASPEVLLRSEALRRVINKRLLLLVKPEYAAMINSSSSAKRELENIANGIPVGIAESAYTVNNDIANNAPKTLTTMAQRASSNIEPEYVVDANIISIMNNVSWNEDEKLNILRANKDRIKLVDALYIRRMASAEDYEDIVTAGKQMVKFFKKNTEMNADDFQQHLEKATSSARNACRNF